ncbi:hypothetical protein KM043_003139 [Ampulex compressa]|nr:hypothetical protein KM043_003139 [Ampulex compressa]
MQWGKGHRDSGDDDGALVWLCRRWPCAEPVVGGGAMPLVAAVAPARFCELRAIVEIRDEGESAKKKEDARGKSCAARQFAGGPSSKRVESRDQPRHGPLEFDASWEALGPRQVLPAIAFRSPPLLPLSFGFGRFPISNSGPSGPRGCPSSPRAARARCRATSRRSSRFLADFCPSWPGARAVPFGQPTLALGGARHASPLAPRHSPRASVMHTCAR